MRRAFQRCSSSLSRNPGLFLTSSRNVQQSLRRNAIGQTSSAIPSISIRSIHQSLIQRQAASGVAERSEPSDSTESNNGIITRFEELGAQGIVHPNVVRTITRDMGLETMTDVQTATINEAIKGTDVIAQARTGTGKTMAFLLPILQRIINVDPHLAERSGGRRGPRTTADDIRALIISPTRELAEQIAEEAKRLTRNTGVIVQTAVGGTQKSAGLRAIQREGCHLLVGTLGRLKDILSDPYSRVEAPDLSALVFDEADRLLDQGFWPEIQEIMRLLPTAQEKDRQTLMFSATVPKEVVELVRSTLKPGFNFVKCVQDNEEPTHERVPQRIVRVKGMENTLPTLIEICQRGIQSSKEADGKPFKAIVYFNSTAEVSMAASALQGLQDAANADSSSQDAFRGSGRAHPFGSTRILEIHAKLSQAERTRAAQNFKTCTSGILLSSDVTARGMDFPNVTQVIQMGLPSSREQYIHRIGRTARAGKEGEGWLILNQMEAGEARSRLSNLPLQKDDTLSIPGLDLTRPGDVPALAGSILSMYQRSIQGVPMKEKAKVYLAQLGIHAWYPRKPELVAAMNNLSQFGWGLRDPPSIPPGLASKLRINNIPGIRIGNDFNDDGPPSRGGDFGGRQGRPGVRDARRSSGYEGDRGYGDRSNRFGGRDAGRGGGGGGGGGGYSGGRSSSYSGGGGVGERSFGGSRRDQAFGNKPVYNDPFA